MENETKYYEEKKYLYYEEVQLAVRESSEKYIN